MLLALCGSILTAPALLLVLSGLLGGVRQGLSATARQAVWRLLWRSRWLLLSLWLILAYGAPGEAWQGFVIAPSTQGMREASHHALRLLVLLLSLGAVLQQLSPLQLVSGIFTLLQPWQRLGLDVARSVVRLSLVLAHLEQTPRGQGWRQHWQALLAGDAGTDDLNAAPASESLFPENRLALPRAQASWRDGLLLLGLAGVLALLSIFPDFP